MPHTKTMWRRILMDARSALAPVVRERHSAAIAERIRAHSAFAGVPALLAYEPMGAEADPIALCVFAEQLGKPVFVPARDRSLAWERWHPDDRFPPAVREKPTNGALAVAAGERLLVLVPGVGFDVRATRLGRGGGFYDRALARLRAERAVLAIGLAFEVQVVADLPVDAWDQPVDLIATEERVIAPLGQADSRRRDAEEVSES